MPRNGTQPPVPSTTSTFSRPKSVFLYFSVVSRLGAGARGVGDSDCLPQAVLISGMQALCCLSPTLVIGPGDQSPGEFTGRPNIRINKGTDAQHRQVVKPPLDPAPKRRPHTETPNKKNRHLQPWGRARYRFKSRGPVPGGLPFQNVLLIINSRRTHPSRLTAPQSSPAIPSPLARVDYDQHWPCVPGQPARE